MCHDSLHIPTWQEGRDTHNQERPRGVYYVMYYEVLIRKVKQRLPTVPEIYMCTWMTLPCVPVPSTKWYMS